MRDILLSIKGLLYERVSSPFYSAFVLSFLILNWRIPVSLFFGDNVELREREAAIQNAIVAAGSDGLVINPFLSAVVIVTVLPGLNWLGAWAVEFWKKRINEVKHSFEKERRLTVKESAQIISEMNTVYERFSRIYRQKDEQIRQRDEQLSSLEKGKAAEDVIKQDLSSEQLSVLRTVYRYLNEFSLNKLIVGRNGVVFFDDKEMKKKHSRNLIAEIYNEEEVTNNMMDSFENLVHSLTPTYLFLLPEMRFGSPYVMKLTEKGQKKAVENLSG